MDNEQTRRYYDKMDELYRLIWSKNGQCRWGYFSRPGLSIEEAQNEATKMLLSQNRFSHKSRVLEIGCGNGTTAKMLVETYGCKVDGIDISGVRIANAQSALREHIVDGKLNLHRGDAENLPYKNEQFTDVISQSTIYHIKNKDAVFSEVARVLQPGGMLILDDIIGAKNGISKKTKKLFYDRLGFVGTSLTSYKQLLNDAGFNIIKMHDITRHFSNTYRKMAKKMGTLMRHLPDKQEYFSELQLAYVQSALAGDKGEAKWHMLVCQKGH